MNVYTVVWRLFSRPGAAFDVRIPDDMMEEIRNAAELEGVKVPCMILILLEEALVSRCECNLELEELDKLRRPQEWFING